MKKYVEGTPAEFFKTALKNDEEANSASRKLEEVIAGKSNINPRFRIPSADTGTEIFFNDPVILERFTNMTLPLQKLFCENIRKVLKEANVPTIRLIVGWSGETKILEIRKSGDDSINTLDIGIL